ncbi:MAG TPA: hypothetical protein VFS20_32565 [Longimicrobium sp.]|nr:hypothetical protein [Longimicrobium sp.]
MDDSLPSPARSSMRIADAGSPGIVLDLGQQDVSRGVSGVIGKNTKQFPLTPLTPREIQPGPIPDEALWRV